MNRLLPDERLSCYPCCVVAVASAIGYNEAASRAALSRKWFPNTKPDGYVTLPDANQFIRSNLNIRKRIDYKRGERVKLKELCLNDRAIVCLLGHYIYLDHNKYYSFFDNENDDVVTVWIIK